MKKVLIAFAGLALVASLALVAPVSATTVDTDALSVALQALGLTEAQINAVMVALSSATSPATHGKFTTVEVTANLAPGSTGEGVRALQQWLNANGYTVATTGAGSPGMESTYYGALTQAAVGRLQDDLGVAYGAYRGYWGPSTRGAIARSVVTDPVDDDDDGDDPADPADPTAPITEGSMDVKLNSTPNNVNVKKGQSKDVMGFEVDVRDSNVTLNRVDLRFNVRPWLYFDSIALMDGSNVVAEKSGLTSSDFTEVTTGSEYRLRILPNYVLNKNTKRNLTVRVSALSFTDREDATIKILTDSDAVRGTDTAGISHTSGWSSDRSFDFEASLGGEIEATLNVNSPLASYVAVSETTDTEDVEMLIFNLKAKNQNMRVNEITVDLETTGTDADVLFKDLQLCDGDDCYGYDEMTSGTTSAEATFIDLDMDISKDSTKTLKVIGKINIVGTGGIDEGDTAYVSLDASNIVGEDANYEDANTGENVITGELMTFLTTVAKISGMSASAGAIVDNPDLADVTLTFTLKAEGNDIYISKDPTVALDVDTTAATSTLDELNSAEKVGDTTAEYFIASGSSRTFEVKGSMDNGGGTAGTKSLWVDAINWGLTDSSPADFALDFGLDALKASRYLTS